MSLLRTSSPSPANDNSSDGRRDHNSDDLLNEWFTLLRPRPAPRSQEKGLGDKRGRTMGARGNTLSGGAQLHGNVVRSECNILAQPVASVPALSVCQIHVGPFYVSAQYDHPFGQPQHHNHVRIRSPNKQKMDGHPLQNNFRDLISGLGMYIGCMGRGPNNDTDTSGPHYHWKVAPTRTSLPSH